jgi:hypothetical protein
LFIVNPSIVQLFIPDCSLLFINERLLPANPVKNQPDQGFVISGTAFALKLGSLDSK